MSNGALGKGAVHYCLQMPEQVLRSSKGKELNLVGGVMLRRCCWLDREYFGEKLVRDEDVME